MTDKDLAPIDVEVKEQTDIVAPANVDVLELIQSRNHVIEQVKKATLVDLNDADFVDMGGKPYLSSTGVRKVRAKFGISVTDSSWAPVEKRDDGHRTYTMRATFQWASSAFDKIEGAEGYGSTSHPSCKPSHDPDSQAKKLATTNCWNRAIKSLLGLEFTWEELGKYKISKKGKSEVKYGGKKTEQAPPKQESLPRPNNDVWEFTTDKGKRLIFASEGDRLTENFLKGCGLKKSKKGNWYKDYDDNTAQILAEALKDG